MGYLDLAVLSSRQVFDKLFFDMSIFCAIFISAFEQAEGCSWLFLAAVLHLRTVEELGQSGSEAKRKKKRV